MIKLSADPKSLFHWKNIVLALAVTLIGGIYTLNQYRDNSSKRDLIGLESTVYVPGKIKQLDGVFSNADAKYSYNYKGVEYEDFFPTYLPCRSKRNSKEVRNKLMQLKFSVAINPQNPKSSYPLLNPLNYQNAGIVIPDNTEYIYRNYIECE